VAAADTCAGCQADRSYLDC